MHNRSHHQRNDTNFTIKKVENSQYADTQFQVRNLELSSIHGRSQKDSGADNIKILSQVGNEIYGSPQPSIPTLGNLYQDHVQEPETPSLKSKEDAEATVGNNSSRLKVILGSGSEVTQNLSLKTDSQQQE